MSQFTATYSPDDNKLRLYASARLESEIYARVKAAGFSWAPKQELFYAPAWSPLREDLLLELAGEIGDEDSSLVDRAEARAERFENYGDKREAEGEQARKSVDAICEHIPLGQPILVGHHSEKRARKDAERIETGIRKSIKLFDTATYWRDRAEGALRNAKYKESPGVRSRRIKGLESDLRKAEKEAKRAADLIAAWSIPDLSLSVALRIANECHLARCFPLADFPRDPPASQYEGQIGLWSALKDGIITPSQAADIGVRFYTRNAAYHARWIAHYQNRLTYERAMLAEQGGGAADRFNIVPGGQVLARGSWLTVLRVNRSGGRVTSVRTNDKFLPVKDISEVSDYRAPDQETAAAAQAAAKLPPLCNYPGAGFAEMTKAAWDKTHKDYKGSKIMPATDTTARHRVRRCVGSAAGMPPGSGLVSVYITDAKRVDVPAAGTLAPDFVPAAPMPSERPARAADKAPLITKAEQAASDLRQSLGAGVKVVAAPQLFPTPSDLAGRVADLADVQPGQIFLEPSAGMGALVDAVIDAEPSALPYMVELSGDLARRLDNKYAPKLAPQAGGFTLQGDFLEVAPNLGKFDRIVMNPPFANGADIAHIKAAAGLLNPGGRLVAICANGPRQQRELKPLAAYWEDLPAGAFAESGTMVSAALLVMESAP
jgi:hypothetical protein